MLSSINSIAVVGAVSVAIIGRNLLLAPSGNDVRRLHAANNEGGPLAAVIAGVNQIDPSDDDGNSRKKLEEIILMMSEEDQETVGEEVRDIQNAASIDTRIETDDFDRGFFESMNTERAIRSIQDVLDEPLSGLKSLFQKFLDETDDEMSDRRLDSSGRFKYATYGPHPEFPDVDLSGMMKRLDGPPSLEYLFSNKEFALKLTRLIVRLVTTEIGLQLTKDDVESASHESKYEAIFLDRLIFGIFPDPINQLLPKPEYSVDNWEKDKEIARQYLAGVNPVVITLVKDLGNVSDSLIEYFSTEENYNLPDLVAAKRLFYVDYKDLADLKVNPHQALPLPMNEGVPQDRPRYFHAPMALLYLDSSDELDLLGIQLERAADAKVYTSTNCNEDVWLFAKTCLANADSQIHEWLSHLGKTHLAMEPHVIASWNILKGREGEYDGKDHPILMFVQPIMQDTLLLNWAARDTLASYGKNSQGDLLSSIGTGQYLQVIAKWWSSYDFFESSSLVSELASRGFDEDLDMPSYLFREDGLEVWNAYGEFASNFVDELYASDADVAGDQRLQDWAEETTAKYKAAVPGFPSSFQSKEVLAKTLQTLAWIGGPLHAAVNFPQYDIYAHQPTKPFHQRQPMPVDGEGFDRQWIFSEGLPRNDVTSEIVRIARLLTLASDHTIDDLDEDFTIDGQVVGSYEKFKQRLEGIKNNIMQRHRWSAWRGEAVYDYLLPSKVPASIDI